MRLACIICGARIEHPTQRRDKCDFHFEQARRERVNHYNKRYYQENHADLLAYQRSRYSKRRQDSDAVIVEYCPDDFYRRGATFYGMDFARKPIAPGQRVYSCWLPGMVIRASDTRYTITQDYTLQVLGA